MHLASSGRARSETHGTWRMCAQRGYKPRKPAYRECQLAVARDRGTTADRFALCFLGFESTCPSARRHPMELVSTRSTQMPRVSCSHAPRASFAPAHGHPLHVCASAGLSYTQIHRQPRLPRHPAEAQHSANGAWACVSECALLRYDVIASSPSAGLCAGVLVVTEGARMCAEHTDSNFGLRARASPLPT